MHVLEKLSTMVKKDLYPSLVNVFKVHEYPYELNQRQIVDRKWWTYLSSTRTQ